MLPAVPLPATNRITITCAVGANVESRPFHPPGGEPVTLAIQADDDHSKNSHLCMANFLFQSLDPSYGKHRWHLDLDPAFHGSTPPPTPEPLLPPN